MTRVELLYVGAFAAMCTPALASEFTLVGQCSFEMAPNSALELSIVFFIQLEVPTQDAVSE